MRADKPLVRAREGPRREKSRRREEEEGTCALCRRWWRSWKWKMEVEEEGAVGPLRRDSWRAVRLAGEREVENPLNPTRRLVAPRGRRASCRPYVALFVRSRAGEEESGKSFLPAYLRSRTSVQRGTARPRRAFKWKRKVNAPIKAAFSGALCISIIRRECFYCWSKHRGADRRFAEIQYSGLIRRILLLIKEKDLYCMLLYCKMRKSAFRNWYSSSKD